MCDGTVSIIANWFLLHIRCSERLTIPANLNHKTFLEPPRMTPYIFTPEEITVFDPYFIGVFELQILGI